ncbi:hypothetical protein KB13_1141 [beta proteobacterium KB13]|uniref:Uncharacterized protein n=1 Tax=beta proteobacterium KB13 TaxID=314607 RepID=B6BVV5_9PROT|nr:hypothetical protein KB13_1141 [beta proteobacterium KB13]
MDAIFKIIDDTITVLSKANIISHPLTIPILGGLVLLLLVWLMLSIRRKKANQLLDTKQSKPAKQKMANQSSNQVKPLSAEDQAYTEKFKKSVAGLDLDLKEDASQPKKTAKATPLTSKQKRELTLDLKALKELLDGSHINQEQHDKKVLELKEAYGG